MKKFNVPAAANRSRWPKRRRGSSTVGRHHPPVCPTSRKIRYRDHQQASDALSSARWRRRLDELDGIESKRNETRAYKCPDCSGWHVTSIAAWVESSSDGTPPTA